MKMKSIVIELDNNIKLLDKLSGLARQPMVQEFVKDQRRASSTNLRAQFAESFAPAVEPQKKSLIEWLLSSFSR